ncbi:MAG: FkbM family methyltransferase [Aeromicrobium sp.]
MDVVSALGQLGTDDAVRSQVVAACKAFERLPGNRFTTVRDDVTGPIVDALHSQVPIARKSLSNGLVVEFPYRSKIARDFVMSSPEIPDHVWEPQTTRLLVHLAAKARVAVVGGAYFGDQAVLIADAMRGRGTCLAFEPDSEQASMVERNAQLNDLDNLKVSTLGLWSSETTLSFVGEDAYAGTVEADTGFRATTIDASAEQVDLIMLDLEGGEIHALRGAEKNLAENAPNIVFEVHGSYVDFSGGLHNTEVVQYLQGFGYQIFAIRDFQSNVDLAGQPIELVPADTAFVEGPAHGFNVLATKDAALADDQLFAITPDVSPKLLFHRDPKLHHPAAGL